MVKRPYTAGSYVLGTGKKARSWRYGVVRGAKQLAETVAPYIAQAAAHAVGSTVSRLGQSRAQDVPVTETANARTAITYTKTKTATKTTRRKVKKLKRAKKFAQRVRKAISEEAKVKHMFLQDTDLLDNCSSNEQLLTSICVAGNYSSTLGPGLGYEDLKRIASTCGHDSRSRNYTFFRGFHADIQLINTSVADTYEVKVYEVWNKKGVENLSTADTIHDMIFADLQNQGVISSGTDDAGAGITPTKPATLLSTRMHHAYTPFQATRFCEQFSVKNIRKFLMPPGDIIQWELNDKFNFKYDFVNYYPEEKMWVRPTYGYLITVKGIDGSSAMTAPIPIDNEIGEDRHGLRIKYHRWYSFTIEDAQNDGKHEANIGEIAST